MTFIDFVNANRVEAVKKRIDKGEARHLTLLALALDCGFNSKSTFNRVFRKSTGLNPSEYEKQSVQGET